MLYACGSNGSGQLGLDHYDDVSRWQPVNLELKGPIQLSGGGNHTVIVEFESGRAWHTVNAQFVPLIHPQNKNWKLASAGWSFIVLVDTDNAIFLLGSGPNGELGLGSVTEAAEVTRLPWIAPDPVVQIDSGLRHSVILTESGQLFGWGASRRSQAGTEARMLATPTKFADGPDNLARIACGRDFTIGLDRSGKLHGWGDMRRFGEVLGGVDPHAQLMAGWSNFLVDTKLFGSTSHNGVRAPPSTSKRWAIGSEHVLWVDKSNTVSTSGWGEHGNCPPPHKFDGDVYVFGGCATSFVYTVP